MTVSFSITHNISHSSGWGRLKASTAAGKLIQSSTGNEWVSAPHSGDAEEGAAIKVTLQTSEKVGKRRETCINDYVYDLIATEGETVVIGHFDGLQVKVENAKKAVVA